MNLSSLGREPALLTALIGWLLTIFIAVTGWILAAIGASRSRTKSFRLDVTEHARREVIPNVIAYQRWIGSLATLLQGLTWLKAASESDLFTGEYLRETWWSQAEALRETLGKSNEALGMFAMLEDYEAVFPQTRDVRIQLIEFHRCLVDFAQHTHSVLLRDMPTVAFSRPDFSWLEVVQESVDAYYDMHALTQDIRVGIQNAALSNVFGTKVLAREPRQVGLPQVVTLGRCWTIRNSLPALPDARLLQTDSD